jgi:hypothetical protein
LSVPSAIPSGKTTAAGVQSFDEWGGADIEEQELILQQIKEKQATTSQAAPQTALSSRGNQPLAAASSVAKLSSSSVAAKAEPLPSEAVLNDAPELHRLVGGPSQQERQILEFQRLEQEHQLRKSQAAPQQGARSSRDHIPVLAQKAPSRTMPPEWGSINHPRDIMPKHVGLEGIDSTFIGEDQCTLLLDRVTRGLSPEEALTALDELGERFLTGDSTELTARQNPPEWELIKHPRDIMPKHLGLETLSSRFIGEDQCTLLFIHATRAMKPKEAIAALDELNERVRKFPTGTAKGELQEAFRKAREHIEPSKEEMQKSFDALQRELEESLRQSALLRRSDSTTAEEVDKHCKRIGDVWRELSRLKQFLPS